MDKTFKILSIDGGGIRGVYPAYILKFIEERLNINLLDAFDMFAGTSTGSIIAAGITSGLSATNIAKMYKEDGVKIFHKKKVFRVCEKTRLKIQTIYESIYDSTNLEDLLSGMFQDKRLGDITKPLIIPSTDIGNGCVHVMKSGYSKDFCRDNDVPVKDAVLASCSAPIYFNPHKLDHYLLADGGLWANNPGLAAVIDAQKRLDINQDNIRIMSMGTGNSRAVYNISKSGRWGLINGWEREKLVNLIFSLQSQSAHNYLSLMLHNEQLKRIDFDSDEPLPMDNTSIVDDLISRADHMFTHESESIKKFILDGELEND